MHRNNLAAEKRIDEDGQSKKDDWCECDICGAEMPSKAYIEQHMRLKHAPNCIICVYCDQDFKTEYEKKVHSFTTHLNVYPIGCEICDERFALFSMRRKFIRWNCFPLKIFRFQEDSAFERHKRDNHKYFVQPARAVSEPSTCSICKIIFPTATELREHLKEHPNTCTICAKRFTTSFVLEVEFQQIVKLFVVQWCENVSFFSFLLNRDIYRAIPMQKYCCRKIVKSAKRQYRTAANLTTTWGRM